MPKLKRPTRKWQSNGILTRILTIEMKLWKSFEKYLKLTKTSLIHKNVKFMTHMDSKVRKQPHSVISTPPMQKICSLNFSRIISLTTIPSSVVSSATNNQMEEWEEDYLVILALLDLAKVCLTMMTFSLEEVVLKAAFLAALSAVTEVDSVGPLNL
jgi:hypothetical protein